MKIYNHPVIDLTRSEEHYVVPSRLDWRMLLILAQAGGWVPAAPDYSTAYIMALGQVVSDAEAQQIADALAAVLDDIPDIDIPIKGSIHLFEYYSGSRKQEIRRFIDFCRRGAFTITE